VRELGWHGVWVATWSNMGGLVCIDIPGRRWLDFGHFSLHVLAIHDFMIWPCDGHQRFTALSGWEIRRLSLLIVV
jgi:hypothetical protein